MRPRSSPAERRRAFGGRYCLPRRRSGLAAEHRSTGAGARCPTPVGRAIRCGRAGPLPLRTRPSCCARTGVRKELDDNETIAEWRSQIFPYSEPRSAARPSFARRSQLIRKSAFRGPRSSTSSVATIWMFCRIHFSSESRNGERSIGTGDPSNLSPLTSDDSPRRSVNFVERGSIYLPSLRAATRINQTYPEVRLIVILRNPTDRAYWPTGTTSRCAAARRVSKTTCAMKLAAP